MLNFWEQLAISATMGLLHQLKVDPTRVGPLKSTLVALMTACCQLLGVEPPAVP